MVRAGLKILKDETDSYLKNVKSLVTNLPVGVGSLLNMDRRVVWDSFLTMLDRDKLVDKLLYYLLEAVQKGGSKGRGSTDFVFAW